MVNTANNVTHEVSKGWCTGEDKVNRLVYRNQLYLYKYGSCNEEIVHIHGSSGGESTDFGKTEFLEDSIYMYARRWSSSSDGAYQYIKFWDTPSESPDGGYSILSKYKKMCFDVVAISGTSSIPHFFWFGLLPFWNGPRGRKITTQNFTGVLELDLQGLTPEDCKMQLVGQGVGFGIFTKERSTDSELTVKQIWLE